MIEVKDLTKKFGAVTAVDGISFEVEKGSIFGFLGPNGAGKTTTISILCTLLYPSSGSAMIDGQDCVKDSAEVRKKIGIVFQDNTLDKEAHGLREPALSLVSIQCAEKRAQKEDRRRAEICGPDRKEGRPG